MVLARRWGSPASSSGVILASKPTFLTANGCRTEHFSLLTRAYSNLVLDQRTPSPLIHGFSFYSHGSCLIVTDKRVRRQDSFSDELVILVGH